MKKAQKAFAVVISAAMLANIAFAMSACKKTAESDEFAVTLEYNDGVSISRTVYVDKEAGGTISEPETPVREGYKFTGWTDSEDGGTKISFPYTPTADAIVYAQWEEAVYDVTFDYNFDSAPDAYVEQIKYKNTVEDPFNVDGKVDGFTVGKADDQYVHSANGDNFTRGEWVTETGVPVSFPYTVKRDVKFNLHWYDSDTQFFYVSFDSNFPNAEEADIIAREEVTGGNRLASTKAPKPTYKYYTRLGWATTKDATAPDVDWPYTPTSDITLYAVWKRDEYQVSFKYNYTGPDNENYQILDKQANGDPLYGGTELASAPAVDPVREHTGFGEFRFLGWYTGEVGGEEVEFPYLITGDVSLYAHWEMPEIETNIFDAEFVYIDPTLERHGFSGEAHGVGIIASGSGSTSEAYPLLGGNNADGSTHTGHFVSYMFDTGAEIVFNIYSSEATTATLKANLANEAGQSVTFDDNGKSAFQFIVNDTHVTYSVTLGANSGFQEFTIGNVQLKAGLNVIRLVTANTNNLLGGTTTGIGPRIDYIKFDGTSATLKWRPEFDNLYRVN